jgi:catechol 2,3-dioxygenase-like lactoylglutathione lyase family enzyme
MGFHHVALATRDAAETHRFYTEVMGFRLVKVVASPTPTAPGQQSTGFSKHFFYATDDSPNGETGMMAFWEIHDSAIGDQFPVDLNASHGLPVWVNHIAFDAPTLDDLHRHRDRWRQHGQTVLEVDHGFCISIYITDPSGNMVEFCHSVRPFTDAEKAHAAATVSNPNPELEDEKAAITVHHPMAEGVTASS